VRVFTLLLIFPLPQRLKQNSNPKEVRTVYGSLYQQHIETLAELAADKSGRVLEKSAGAALAYASYFAVTKDTTPDPQSPGCTKCWARAIFDGRVLPAAHCQSIDAHIRSTVNIFICLILSFGQMLVQLGDLIAHGGDLLEDGNLLLLAHARGLELRFDFLSCFSPSAPNLSDTVHFTFPFCLTTRDFGTLRGKPLLMRTETRCRWSRKSRMIEVRREVFFFLALPIAEDHPFFVEDKRYEGCSDCRRVECIQSSPS
jgi:hypothetical protein